MRTLILSAGLAMVVAQATTVGWPQAQDIAGSLDVPQAAAEFDQRVPHVNARWPEAASLGPMPPRVLAALPALPDDLEYRFLDRDFILWDSHADIIVDFIRKALP